MSRFAKAAVVTATTGFALAGAVAPALADAGADAAVTGSPGVVSGNAIQIPVHVPINLCNLSVNIVGLLNPVAGNVCINNDSEHAKQINHTHK